jgi:hypothetical protein
MNDGVLGCELDLGGHVVRVGWECAARSGLGVVHLELEVYRSPPQKS